MDPKDLELYGRLYAAYGFLVSNGVPENQYPRIRGALKRFGSVDPMEAAAAISKGHMKLFEHDRTEIIDYSNRIATAIQTGTNIAAARATLEDTVATKFKLEPPAREVQR